METSRGYLTSLSSVRKPCHIFKCFPDGNGHQDAETELLTKSSSEDSRTLSANAFRLTLQVESLNAWLRQHQPEGANRSLRQEQSPEHQLVVTPAASAEGVTLSHSSYANYTVH